jgi:hypothetical protein
MVGAFGCGLWRAGAAAGGGLVWCSGGHARAAAMFSCCNQGRVPEGASMAGEAWRREALGRIGQAGSLPGQLALPSPLKR